MHLVLISGIVNSALYLTGVFVAGIVLDVSAAWRLSLLTMALCYLAALWQTLLPIGNQGFHRFITLIIVALTIIIGALAGFFLMLTW